MNTSVLRKHYDKLTPRERLAAMIEAEARNDEGEIIALGQAAPKMRYEVTHHYFLEEALKRLEDIHMIEMLNYGCVFYMGLWMCRALEEKGEEERADKGYSDLTTLAESILVSDQAWRKFCEGLGIDPDKSLLNLPGSGCYSPDAPARSGMDTLPALLRYARVLAITDPDPANIEELAEAYRAALYRHAGQQSGGWG